MIKNQFKVVFKVNCLLRYQIGHNYKAVELKISLLNLISDCFWATYLKFFIKKDPVCTDGQN